VLHEFNFGDGYFPQDGLVFDGFGNLYGTTFFGGDRNHCEGGCGVIFKLMPESGGVWKETVLHYFVDNPGAWPIAGLTFDATGNIFGTTGGWAGELGSVFEIMP
jgi:uncharacterized repeat protein (TIGR03803 family)